MTILAVMNTTVSALEIKTHFGKYLSGVERNDAEYVITRHERPVARLVPMRTGRGTRAAVLRRLAAGAARRKTDKLTTKQLIEEGRK
jgi:prevent-host-death family protein